LGRVWETEAEDRFADEGMVDRFRLAQLHLHFSQ
jgi:hypothetical protein